MPRLDEEAIGRELASLPEWTREGDTISRTFQRGSFVEAMSFVGVVAGLAEAANHHPDFHISYRTVTLSLTTHDEGGLTDRDIEMARRIDAASTGGR
jgi:4a-hydroxytetrahydrobiopterin dehydratase